MYVMEQAERLLQLVERKGVIRAVDLGSAGIQRVYLTRLLREGRIERFARGIYTLPGALAHEHTSLVVAAKRVPHGVICLLSALQFHGLTTQAPSQVWLALGHGQRTPKLDYPPLRAVRYGAPSLRAGVEVYWVQGVEVRVFGVAKTVADLFKYRSRVGLDVALEALKEGWEKRRLGVDELMEYARINRVKRVIRPYFEAIAA